MVHAIINSHFQLKKLRLSKETYLLTAMYSENSRNAWVHYFYYVFPKLLLNIF